MMPFLQVVVILGKVVIALVIVLDPVALMPVFVGITNHLDPSETRRVVVRIVSGATVMLLFFAATGTWVLNLFAVTLDDLRIGGGLLLLIIALKMVVEGRIGSKGEDQSRAALVPLISPLLVGPGAITAAVVFAGLYGIAITCVAAVIAMAISLGLLLGARSLQGAIGEAGTELITRIMGVLIATIAVSYIRVGIINVIRALVISRSV